ncbi:MAG TPA: DUF402 domain-containing protein [Roseiflexaceae bacterium]|nr:DUF402 domain-containing protein [Roseiflexaceae bacterium]
MIALAYHYRRRHLSGETAISISSGAALAQRDDPQAWVFDYRLAGPVFTEPAVGRRGASVVTIARPEPVAVRLWLWPDRPLRLLELFDAAGQPTVYRVDFATRPRRQGYALYQTDLYLDLFATPDERDYAILDEDELAIGRERGLIDAALYSAILAQADQLADLLEKRRFGDWLASWCDRRFDLAGLREQPAWHYREYAPGQPDGWIEEGL